VQDNYYFFWQEDRVHDELEKIMKRSFNAVFSNADKYDVDPRVGAYILAIGRVEEATTLRGIYP
ncbi:MAG: glutamate dehydrogenase, partial [bacterium]